MFASVHYILQTWNPINNKKFEVLSYLPPLSDDSIAKEIDYMLKKGWIPCLEFDEVIPQFFIVYFIFIHGNGIARNSFEHVFLLARPYKVQARKLIEQKGN